MSYKDPDRQREYQKEYARTRRQPAGVCQTPGRTPVPPEFRIKTARDVLDLLAGQIAAVQADEQSTTLEKARVVGSLAAVALRAVEAADLAGRVEALEQALKLRSKESTTSWSQTPWPSITPTSHPESA